MKIVALTGGIACGKSTVARRWASKGMSIVDADMLSRQAVEKSSMGWCLLVKQFGESILSEDGTIDRKLLGKIAFYDRAARRRIEEIIHPEVRFLASLNFLNLSYTKSVACYDVPLLFETGLDKVYSPIVVVSAHPDIQRLRLMQRNSLTENEADARINSQMPMKDKLSRADFVIDNSGSLDELHEQCDIVLATIS